MRQLSRRRKNEGHRSSPYLRFAQMVQQRKTRPNSHPEEDHTVCCAVQYGMGAESLAISWGRLDTTKQALRAHKDTFPTYWGGTIGYSTRVWKWCLETVFLEKAVRLGKPASVGNFPVQGNGAEMKHDHAKGYPGRSSNS